MYLSSPRIRRDDLAARRCDGSTARLGHSYGYGLLNIQHTHRRLKWDSVLAHGRADD